MQIKIFKSNPVTVHKLEEQVNQWLARNPNYNVKEVVTSQHQGHFIMTVLFTIDQRR